MIFTYKAIIYNQFKANGTDESNPKNARIVPCLHQKGKEIRNLSIAQEQKPNRLHRVITMQNDERTRYPGKT